MKEHLSWEKIVKLAGVIADWHGEKEIAYIEHHLRARVSSRIFVNSGDRMMIQLINQRADDRKHWWIMMKAVFEPDEYIECEEILQYGY